MSNTTDFRVVVLISSNVEWQVVCELFPDVELQVSPFGGWFWVDLAVGGHIERVVFFHGGWGKVAAAASTQYVIDRWSPSLLVNLGTCGGFEGKVERGTVLLVKRTLIYDIVERISDPAEAIDHYTTELDLSWLNEPFPISVYPSLLVSADRDLVSEEVSGLRDEFGAIAGDWESGAIAYVAVHNRTRCLILRGVSDLVGGQGGEVYGDPDLFTEYTEVIMRRLVDSLPAWIAQSFE